MLAHGQPAHAADDAKAAGYYEDALSRYQARDWPTAIIQLKNALREDRKQLPAQLLLGKALLANSDVAGAEVAFTQALALGVNRAEVVVPLAQSLIGQGKQQSLLEDPRFALTGLPDKVRSQLLLVRASAQADTGLPRDALASIQEARALDPAAAEVWLAEVPLRIRARQFKEAVTAVERAEGLGGAAAEAAYQRASIAHAQSALPAALSAYDVALRLQAEHLEARIARAGLLIDLQRFDAARADLAAIKRVRPSEPRAAFLRAVLAEQDGDTAAAKAAMNEVCALLDPVPTPFLRYRPQMLMLGGLAHYGLGEREKAKPYLEAVLRLQPGSPVSKLLAQIYLSERNIDRAVDTLSAYLKAMPDDAQALTLLAARTCSRAAMPKPLRCCRRRSSAATRRSCKRRWA